MAVSRDVPTEGGGALGAVDRAFSKVENVLNGIATVFIFMLMIMLVCEVLGRKLLNAPIPGTIDWVEVWMATFAFLGAAYCQRHGGHVRMELVVGNLKGRILWATEAFAVIIAMVYIAIVVNKSFVHFLRALQIGDSTIDIQLVLWPSKLIVPIALSALFIRLAINLWGYLRLFGNPNLEPIAVPLILDPAQQAREEIKDILHDDGRGDGPGAGTR